MKINKITELRNHTYAHICPICGKILVSNDEREMLPEFSMCDCEIEEWKFTTFKQYGTDEQVTMVLHQTAPEFGFVVTSDGELIDTSENHWDSEEQCAEWMKAAAQYIENKEPIREL